MPAPRSGRDLELSPQGRRIRVNRRDIGTSRRLTPNQAANQAGQGNFPRRNRIGRRDTPRGNGLIQRLVTALSGQ